MSLDNIKDIRNHLICQTEEEERNEDEIVTKR